MEGAIITSDLYYADNERVKFIPVVASPSDSTHIPYPLLLTTWYDIGTIGQRDLRPLLRHLLNQPAVVAEPLGKIELTSHVMSPSGPLPPGSTNVSQQTIFGVPRTVAQRERLLQEKPEGWEYLLFAGLLLQGKESLENRYINHQIGLASITPKYLDDAAARNRFPGALRELSAIISRIPTALDARAQSWALGEPDSERIEHLASQIIKRYEELLDWAETMRSFVVSSKLQRLFDLAGHLADQPIEEIRNFIGIFVEYNEKLSEKIISSQGSPIDKAFTVSISLDDQLKDTLTREMAKAFCLDP